jgi:hypothetical protein
MKAASTVFEQIQGLHTKVARSYLARWQAETEV